MTGVALQSLPLQRNKKELSLMDVFMFQSGNSLIRTVPLQQLEGYPGLTDTHLGGQHILLWGQHSHCSWVNTHYFGESTLTLYRVSTHTGVVGCY